MVRTRSSKDFGEEEDSTTASQEQQQDQSSQSSTASNKSKRGKSSTTPPKGKKSTTPSKKDRSTEEEGNVDETAPASKEEQQQAAAAVDAEPKIDDEMEEVGEETEKIVFTEEDLNRGNELFKTGKRDYKLGNIVNAREALSKSCEIIAGFYGDGTLQTVDPIYFYGMTVLDLARREPDVVAAAVSGTCLDKIDEEQEMGEEAAAKEKAAEAALIDDNTETEGDKMTQEQIRDVVLNALDENAKTLEEAAAGKKTTSGEEAATGDDAATGDQSSTKKKDEKVEPEVIEEEGAEESAGEDDDDVEGENDDDKESPDEVPNLQLAFELFDTCRVILEKHDDDASQLRLADVRVALGEQGMEDEEFERAAADLNAGLELYKKLLDADDRRIATTYYQIGTMFNLQENYEKSAENYRMAADILKLHANNVTEKLTSGVEGEEEKSEMEKEVKELEALIADVEARIQDCVESRAEADKVQAEMEQEKQKNGTDAQESLTSGEANGAKVLDVTHLVRRSVKRNSGMDQDAGMEEPTKKAKMDATAAGDDAEVMMGDENGHGSNGKEAALKEVE